MDVIGKVLSAAALLLAGGLSAAQANPGDKDELLELLDQQTRIATKTRLNADYVPGILSVLQGRDLENRGIRTVWEALELVPGLSVVIDAGGRKQLIVRGVGKVYASGNVKTLLNGVAVNNETFGLAGPVLNMPIEQVARIEFIRGPGSAVHGQYAYVGVMDVITRSDGDRFFARTGSFSTGAGGLLLESGTNGWEADLNLAFGRSDGAGGEVGQDALYELTPSLAAYSHAPGPANEKRRDATGILNVRNGGFSLLGQWSETRLGDHFGINTVLPPPGSALVERNRLQTIELRQALESGDWATTLYLGHKALEKHKDDLYGGPGAFYNPDATDPDLPVYVDLLVRENRRYSGVDLSWRGLARHALMLSLAYHRVHIDDSYLAYNLDANANPTETTTRYPGYPAQGDRRHIRSVMLQDEYRAGNRLTVTAGVRYDDYSDVGGQTTPRLATVWRASARHVLKAQYARAFRPPTLYELSIIEAYGGDAELKPATIDTGELGYIYKGDVHDARVTFYRSTLNGLILYRPAGYFANDQARSVGVELEYTGRLTPALHVDGNVGYSHTQDDTADGAPIAGTPRWTANLGVQYRLTGRTMVALQQRAVGPYSRQTDDPRGPSEPYTTTDVALVLNNIAGSGASLRAGVKNALDADVRHPAPSLSVAGEPAVPYPDDLPRPGREWWLQFAYEH